MPLIMAVAIIPAPINASLGSAEGIVDTVLSLICAFMARSGNSIAEARASETEAARPCVDLTTEIYSAGLPQNRKYVDGERKNANAVVLDKENMLLVALRREKDDTRINSIDFIQQLVSDGVSLRCRIMTVNIAFSIRRILA